MQIGCATSTLAYFTVKKTHKTVVKIAKYSFFSEFEDLHLYNSYSAALKAVGALVLIIAKLTI